MSEPNLNDILSGGGLSALLQNPDVAAKLPRIMEALAPVMAEMRAESNPDLPKDEVSEVKAEETAKETVALSPKKHHDSSATRRRALLHALEPYLSDSRREAMDHVNKVLLLIDMLSEVI